MKRRLSVMVLGAASTLGCAQIFGFEPGTLIESGSGPGSGPGSGAGGDSTTSTGAGAGSGGGTVIPTGETVWSKSFGDDADQYPGGIAISAEGPVVAGSFWGTIDFGDGSPHLNSPEDLDAFLAKLATADGATVFSKAYGDDNGNQWAHDVAVGSDGRILLSDGFESTIDFGGGPRWSAGEDDIYIASLDANAGHLWSERYGDGAGQVANGVAISPSGVMAVTGGYNDEVDFGDGILFNNGDLDVFVAVFDAQHNVMWSKGFGSGGADPMAEYSDEGMAVAIDSQGNVIVAGYFKADMSIDGYPLEHFDDTDVFVAKFDSEGGLIWANAYGDGGDGIAVGLAVGIAPAVMDHLYVVGTFTGRISFGGPEMLSLNDSDDAFLVDLTPTGGLHAQRSAGWEHDGDIAQGVATDAQGNIVLIGLFRQQMDWNGPQPLMGHPDGRSLFIVKLDQDFEHLWDRVWGTGEDWHGDWRGDDVAMDPQGNVYVTATIDGTVDTGVNVHTSLGADVLVARLKP